MEKFTIHKNKPELFKCQLDIDGTSSSKTIVRLCLEFANNHNLFFYGKLAEDGKCEIQIPALPDVTAQEGKLCIEAIADSTYFKVYEADVELKNNVVVNMVKTESQPTPSVKLESNSPTLGTESIKMKKEVNPFIPKKKAKGFASLDQFMSKYKN